MKNLSIILGLMSAFMLFSCRDHVQKNPPKSIPFNQVQISDAFWSPKLHTHATSTLQACIAQTRDSTERINNFIRAAGLEEGKHKGIYFDDSDVYKAMEGIAYSLVNNPNPELMALLDQWIDLVAKSQQPDGYLNTFYTLNHPDQRWTNMEKHEMYCGGHMIEAAVAHYKATGKRSFLEVAVKFADHIDNTFGPGKRHWVPGHEEIELALVKLYHVTNEKRYLDLAYWLLEERGHGHGKGGIWERNHWGAAYCQDDVPVSEITDIKGHAVRAMYLFTGMADVASELDLSAYVAALERVWDDVVNRNMYITGGIGSSGSNEGFTNDYDLPNKTAYCETCASIGMVLWNNRMNLLSQDAKYADVMERSLYNGVLPGVSQSGNLFFYVNPLESEGDHHRKSWYGCACCPSNISRFIPSVGNYVYIANENELFVNLYMGSSATIDIAGQKVRVLQVTNYPWDGKIEMTIEPARKTHFAVSLRIPGWCKNYGVALNGKKIKGIKLEKGYLRINNTWNPGDRIILTLEMPAELVAADPRVVENTGKRAIQKGPIVYCIEETDNKNQPWENIKLTGGETFKERKAPENLPEDAEILQTGTEGKEITFIPYFLWDNREHGRMKVWIDVDESQN